MRLRSIEIQQSRTIARGVSIGHKDLGKFFELLCGNNRLVAIRWTMKIPYIQHSSPFERYQQNLTRTLLGLHHFGYMRYAELARLVWPMSSPASRQANASRFFKVLCEEKLIHRGLNSIGSYSYVLTGKGAREVRKLISNAAFDGTRIYGLMGVEVFHRSLGTAWLIEQLIAGHEVLSEYAINSLPGEITRKKLNKTWGKLPDGLVLREVCDAAGQLLHYNVDWLEVESSYKSPAQRERMMEMAWSLGKQLLSDTPYYLDRIVFLYASTSKHERALVRSAVAKFQATRQEIDDPKGLLGSIVLASADASLPLRIRGFSEVDLFSHMQRDHRLSRLISP